MIKKILILIFFLNNISYSQNVQLDNTFIPGDGFNQIVNSISLLNNGKLIVGGNFNQYNNVTAKNVVQLNSNGTLDTNFSVGSGISNTSFINKTYIQNDGKILVAGAFSSFNGETRKNILRLNSDGSTDPTFVTPNFSGGTIGQGTIYDIQIVNDKILVAGDFTSPRKYLVMLNMDGSVVDTFIPQLPITDTGTNNGIYKIEIQSDNKIIVCRTKYINRYNFDGTTDNSFPILEASTSDIGYPLLTCKLQADGKILVGGRITMFNNLSSKQIVRINNDGSLDNTFNTGTGLNSGGQINAIELTNDNKILIAGSFNSYNNIPTTGIARLLNDGSYDVNFTSGTGIGGLVKAILLDDNQKILVGGSFVGFNGIESRNISRLTVNENLRVTLNNFKDKIKVYPNPTTDNIEITTENSILESYILYNIDGKILEEKAVNNRFQKINLSNYCSGLYIIKIGFENQIYTYSIIKE